MVRRADAENIARVRVHALLDGRDVPADAVTLGEIALRGPNVFFEYWGDEAATREALRDGWYLAGNESP